MICAKSYTGELAPKWAHDLVLELRSRYDLPAYVYNRGAEERQRFFEERERQRRQQEEYLRQAGLQPDMPPRLPHVRIEEQCAVLIGGFKDMESARKALERIKKLEPPKSVPADNLLVARPNGKGAGRRPVEAAPMNPFVASFVVRNPTVPEEKPAEPPGVDSYDFLKKLNAGESYSLLKCGKPWTLAIKEFRGTTIIQSKATPDTFIQQLFGKHGGEQLSATAMNAHNMAEALNKIGFKAYVLHTRTASVVCVGAYDKPDDHALETTRQAIAKNLQISMNMASPDGSGGLMPQLMPMPVPQPGNSQFKNLVKGQQ
jgi:hypothetical protein